MENLIQRIEKLDSVSFHTFIQSVDAYECTLFRRSSLQHLDNIGHFPKFVGHASGHRGSDPERLVNADEIVIHRMERDRGGVVFDLF